MHCREAFICVANHEQDGDLAQFIQTQEGAQVESHVSHCGCSLCHRTSHRIQSAMVRFGLHVIEGKRTGM